MKKFVVIVAVAAMALLADSQLASARRGGCGGGRGGCGRSHCGGGHGGCGMGGCGMGGCGMGASSGCGMGGCGMSGSGGCGMVGCGIGGCGMGGSSGCGMGGGVHAGGVVLQQTNGTEATLIVTLPEGATLTIDDENTQSTSAHRVFVTPALEQGKEYEYILKAKLVRDGAVQVTTTKVTFRSGETKSVELKVPAAGVAAQ